MRLGFYRRLAWTGIRQNKKMYLPYILACIGVVMVCYIVSFLGLSPVLKEMPGGGSAQSFLNTGFGVMCVFSTIFLFYTNSFLIRRRKKEFGLYNILGMGKRHLACVVIWEAVFLAGLSLAAGLLLGILLSKTAELGMVRLVSAQTDYRLRIEVPAIRETLAIFGVIHLLILLNSLRQIHRTNPLELLRSESALIQTVGRAARNSKGRVVMYADEVTDSMRRAIDETNRRRGVQAEYNREHGIVPRTVKREFKNTLEITKKRVDSSKLSPKDLVREIERLKGLMKTASAALDFESAIKLRDEMNELKKQVKKL